MGRIIDIKPNSSNLIDTKPTSNILRDIKPGGNTIGKELNKIYNVTLGAGMLVGFGPAITYPQSINILSPKSL